jgi:hypothetical protein
MQALPKRHRRERRLLRHNFQEREIRGVEKLEIRESYPRELRRAYECWDQEPEPRLQKLPLTVNNRIPLFPARPLLTEGR